MQLIFKFLTVVGIFAFFIMATSPNTQIGSGNQNNSSDTYILDTAKSKLHWTCHHIGELKFNHGLISIQDKDLKDVNLNIDMNSISNSDIDNELLQGTLANVLKSVEFFNTKKYPEAKYESHAITKINDSTYNFEGDFIIFGIGICQNFEGSIKTKADSLYFVSKPIILNRTDWGIYYLSTNNPKPKEEENSFVVSDTILVEANIIAYKKQ